MSSPSCSVQRMLPHEAARHLGIFKHRDDANHISSPRVMLTWQANIILAEPVERVSPSRCLLTWILFSGRIHLMGIHIMDHACACRHMSIYISSLTSKAADANSVNWVPRWMREVNIVIYREGLYRSSDKIAQITLTRKVSTLIYLAGKLGILVCFFSWHSPRHHHTHKQYSCFPFLVCQLRKDSNNCLYEE